jgi:hypothetical protein
MLIGTQKARGGGGKEGGGRSATHCSLPDEKHRVVLVEECRAVDLVVSSAAGVGHLPALAACPPLQWGLFGVHGEPLCEHGGRGVVAVGSEHRRGRRPLLEDNSLLPRQVNLQQCHRRLQLPHREAEDPPARLR